MREIQTGFIKPNGEIDFLDYYEVENYCKREVERYQQTYSERDAFLSFQQEYTYFKPYLDFVIFHMGYVQIHPFFMDGYLGYGVEDGYYIKPYSGKLCYPDRKNGAFYFQRANDVHYDIKMGAVSSNSMVDVQGNVFTLFSKGDTDTNAWGHPGLSCMFLHQFSSFSKLLCEDFQNYCQENHPNIYTMYAMERLGFMPVTNRRSHHLVYLNRNLLTQKQLDIAYWTKEYYGSDLQPFGKREKEEGHAKKLIREIWGDVYENR